MSVCSIPQSSKVRSQSKKTKSVDVNNCLHKTLIESGLILKHPPEKCIAKQETIHLVRNIEKNLQKCFNRSQNISQLCTELDRECQDINVFKHYLFPNVVIVNSGSSEEHPVNDSVIKILLNIPDLQTKLINNIFEKATRFATEGQCKFWIQMILKCFSNLYKTDNTKIIITRLLNLLDITTENVVKLDIITAIPAIIQDQEHDNVAVEMSRILSMDHNLIPAILECLSCLCLSTDEQYEQLQKKTLDMLLTLPEHEYYCNFVQFLLKPDRGRMSGKACFETVQGLRNALDWPLSMEKPQEIATSQVLTCIEIRNSMVLSEVTANAWYKVISTCKLYTDHKPIDFVILLILYSTSEEKQKQIENFIRKQIKLHLLKEELIEEAFDTFKPVVKEYLRHLIDLTNTLLKMRNDPLIESFACHCYMLMFSKLDDCCQTIVAELLQLGLNCKQCVTNILFILNNVASKDLSLLKSQSQQMLTILNRISDMTLSETRAVMDLVCGLAYSYENSVIRDDIHMLITKGLCSSSPTINIQGILAGVYAVKYLIAKNTDDNPTTKSLSDDSVISVSPLVGDNSEAAQIIELIISSTKKSPDLIVFYYDELAKVMVSLSTTNKKFIQWLTKEFNYNLQENYIVNRIENKQCGHLQLEMQYCLYTEGDMDNIKAINIAGLALQPKSEVDVATLAPLLQLIQILQSKQRGDINVLLGYPVVMPKINKDNIENMDPTSVSNILNCLIHCVNWFRELLNAFSTQNDNTLETKLINRLFQIQEIENLIEMILLKTSTSYEPPICTFNISKYTADRVEKRHNKSQNVQQKTAMKSAHNDMSLTGTARSQATQNNPNTIKNNINVIHTITFRQLNLNLLRFLKSDISSDKNSHFKLTVKSLNFLLICINKNLEKVLISKIKRKTFLTKEDDCAAVNSREMEECAKSVSEILPETANHIKYVIAYIGRHISHNNSDNEDECMYTPELMDYIICLEYLYNMCTIYFKWIGFKDRNNALLKSSLRTIASADGDNAISLNDLLLSVAKYLQQHEKYCLQLSTAVSLVEFLKTIQDYSDSTTIQKILRNTTENFLSHQWKTLDGVFEKGLTFNRSVDRLTSIYFINNDITALRNLTPQLINDIKTLKTRNDTMRTLKTINKGNFPILYKNLATAVYEATKSRLNKISSNSEHLSLWKDVATILKHLSDIVDLKNKNTLSVFFKKSLPILKLLSSQGIPIIEREFKNATEEVLEILKILQKSTKFLHFLCSHFRGSNDTALMSKIPYMKKLLEEVVYKVKAALAVNNCSNSFWMDTLRNKNIHGQEIASEQSTENVYVEDCDEQLPDDDSDETDNEMIDPDSMSTSDII